MESWDLKCVSVSVCVCKKVQYRSVARRGLRVRVIRGRGDVEVGFDILLSICQLPTLTLLSE